VIARSSPDSTEAQITPREEVVKATVPANVSKWKTRDERVLNFDLADFANLGDTPDGWKHFHQKCDDFFLPDMTEWIYINAEVWWNLSNLPDKRPGNYQEIVSKWQPESHATFTDEEWASLVRECRSEMPRLRPPLLYFRNVLRRVWRREDPYGNCLKVLLGFDEACAPVLEDGEETREDPVVFEEKGQLITFPGHVDDGSLFMWKAPEGPKQHRIASVTWVDKQTATCCGLPIGTPVVDGDTGNIGWEFGCKFQTDVYYLMQERWRARTCPWCNKYFVADKAMRKYCSTKCSGERKQKQVLDFYHHGGKARRQESKAKKAGAHKRKS
jgi:hypothetical protein